MDVSSTARPNGLSSVEPNRTARQLRYDSLAHHLDISVTFVSFWRHTTHPP